MKALVCASLLVATAFVALPAAATNRCNKPALQFFGDDTGGITWQSPRLDSPRDPNKSRLLVHVLRQTSDDYAGAYNDCTGIEGKTLGQVRNLSFDFLNDSSEPAVHTGAGSPRISVIIDADGDGTGDNVAYLSALYCQEVLSEDPRWSRADFTGRVLAGCQMYTTFAALPYESDGSLSAWAKLAADYPNAKVTSAFFILDEEGTAFIDRLAFQNKMFQASGTGSAAIRNCGSESAC